MSVPCEGCCIGDRSRHGDTWTTQPAGYVTPTKLLGIVDGLREDSLSASTSPFHLEITSNGAGYKSISDLKWHNIPDFSILTGRNGSGKTQLLEVLVYHLTGTRPQQAVFDINVKVEGTRYEADQVAHVPSTGRFSGGGGASIAQMQNIRSSMFQNLQNRHSYQHDPVQTSRIKRTERLLAGRDWQQVTNNGQKSFDDDEFFVLLADVDVTANLATIFVDHRVKMLEARERDTPGFGKDGKPLGPAPWDVVNESLQVAGFPYEVVSPITVGLTEHYDLMMNDKISGKKIRPSDLSSGEQVLLQLTLWLFSSGKEGVFPKLLLLDEPDAHLHPSMTVQFLNVISEVLVRKHGVRVIMTTHSPSTVALAPEDAVFEMERGGAEVQPVTDRAAIISVLTAGLVTVSRATRFCFVEDEDDVAFYNAILDILTDAGPSKDPHAIRDTPSLVFIPASVGRGADKVSGGKTIVEKWVDKLDAPPLTTVFLGVLDRDSGNQASARIKVIGRYSFENYLLDPINVFGLLLENKTAPAINQVTVTSGDEHVLRSLPDTALQAITNVITSKVESLNPGLVTVPYVQVEYTRGMKVEMPRWVIDHRGHDLLRMYQEAWGNPQIVNPPRLVRALRRVRLVPRELATLYIDLQT